MGNSRSDRRGVIPHSRTRLRPRRAAQIQATRQAVCAGMVARCLRGSDACLEPDWKKERSWSPSWSPGLFVLRQVARLFLTLEQASAGVGEYGGYEDADRPTDGACSCLAGCAVWLLCSAASEKFR